MREVKKIQSSEELSGVSFSSGLAKFARVFKSVLLSSLTNHSSTTYIDAESGKAFTKKKQVVSKEQ